MRFPQVQERSVLVTGCSSGIGAAAAHFLREQGWRVIPTARKDVDLENLRTDGFEPVELDLADSASVQSAADTVLELLDGRLGAIVNNAGFAQPGAMEDISRDALRRQFEVNVFGMQELTNRFIPGFRAQGFGRIVNVSSIFGLVSLPMVGAYCATKFAMEALSDALRVELRKTGVAVSLVEPGAIITNIRDNAAVASENLDQDASRFGEAYARELARRKNRTKKPDLFTRPPEDVAHKIRHALESSRPRARYRVTIPAHVVAFLTRVLPAAVFDHLLAKRVSKEG